jgi:hypothetical protein
MQFDRGYQDAHILIYEKMLSSLQPLPSILEAVVQTGKPPLIVAEDIERRRGGGVTLLGAEAAVGKLEDENADVQAGINIALRTLESPSHQIAENTGNRREQIPRPTSSTPRLLKRNPPVRPSPGRRCRRSHVDMLVGRRVGRRPHTYDQAVIGEAPKK